MLEYNLIPNKYISSYKLQYCAIVMYNEQFFNFRFMGEIFIILWVELLKRMVFTTPGLFSVVS